MHKITCVALVSVCALFCLCPDGNGAFVTFQKVGFFFFNASSSLLLTSQKKKERKRKRNKEIYTYLPGNDR